MEMHTTTTTQDAFEAQIQRYRALSACFYRTMIMVRGILRKVPSLEERKAIHLRYYTMGMALLLLEDNVKADLHEARPSPLLEELEREVQYMNQLVYQDEQLLSEIDLGVLEASGFQVSSSMEEDSSHS